jgi:hypothetical protein
MNTKTRPRRHVTLGRADQRIDAGGVAHGARDAQLRLQFATRLHDPTTGFVACVSGAATLRKAFSYAGPHPTLTQDATHQPPCTNTAAKRIEKDRQVATLQRVEKLAKPMLYSSPFKITLRRDPFAAAWTTSIGLALCYKKNHRF